ncbi:ABC transporter ATPase [Mesohalobacter halotolerans]|uniref:ABC transporter ATPase n=1 Tax=Mesohalobacter halotolerans TaxID=1883405 RepID=A0A4V6ALF8_9FLAO|nr:ABC transporter ATPase [Mesohalobacter halotolerans]MBS3737640.1 ABC transporter ATPase [Psychroflexus sp.]TKS56575.1 ABC transporter ATPase [Mesohalobacter halotolerans]
MLVKFDELPKSSKIWVYQCNRSFTEEEISKLNKDIKTFLEAWSAHGNQLKTSFLIKYRRFIIISVDESQSNASGCSIDSMVHFIQSLEKEFKVDLLDKMNVSYKHGEHIAFKPLLDFKKMVKQRAVNANTIVFNNLVASKQEFEDYWEVPLKDSWHARFL